MLAVAIGPLVGGAVTTGWAWQYIFWLNVPVGLVLIPLARWKLVGVAWPPDPARSGRRRSGQRRAPRHRLRAGAGQLARLEQHRRAVVVRGRHLSGWPPSSGGSSVSTEPMLPLRLFKNRAFAAVNVTAMLFSFGMFGSIFFLSQFLQTVQGYSPLSAGLRVLPWTGMTMLLAPFVGGAGRTVGRQAVGGVRAVPAGRRVCSGWACCSAPARRTST